VSLISYLAVEMERSRDRTLSGSPEQTCHPDSDDDESRRMIRDLGYGESRESRSMFSEGLATTKCILGATNAPRLMSPMRAHSDVSSAHAVELRKRDDSVREVDIRFI